MPLYFVLTTVFTSIVYWMTNLNTQPDRFLTCWAVVALVNQIAIAYCIYAHICFVLNKMHTEIFSYYVSFTCAKQLNFYRPLCRTRQWRATT